MMTKKWQPYPTYKDSGVEWLGAIPEHWEVKRLKYVCCINPSKSPISNLSLDTEISFVPMEYVDNYGNIDLRETKTLREVSQGYTYFQNKDVIIAKITPCFENGKGALCSNLHNTIGFGSTEFHVIRVISNKTIPEFTYYLTKSTRFTNLGSSELYGVAGQKRVPESFLSNYVTGIPPLPEQQKIAEFLDQETGKIDKLITKKERLIELLKEKRTALISHAVTKGLNPDVPMKDSGVEWLGEIPEHWEVKRLKFLITESLKYGANESAQLEDKDCPRFIRITDITEDGLLKEDTFRSLPKDIAKPFILKTGDILFARSGATFGKSFMYREQWGIACHAGYLIRARLKLAEALPEFVSYFANSSVYWDWISSIFIQATIQNVSAEKYANLWMGVPDIQEQQKIAQFLDRETSKIDNLITKTRTSIDHLKEYRTALISAAVTGKIDVREH
jgi:type I restriction enzyme S subunit